MASTTPRLVLGTGLVLLSTLTGSLAGHTAPPWTTLSGARPEVIAHRGASGERPEHTIEAYSLAIEQGADWIEPDLVVTKDNVLVCRHDRYLSSTTDVASRPEFADRRTTKKNGTAERSDWWAEDFTLAELRSLRALQPRDGRSKAYDGKFLIPTFEEVIALAKASSRPERVIGVMPETKAPGALTALGHDIAGLLIAALTRADWRDETAPVVVQSFEPEILQILARDLPVRRAQLVFAVAGEDGTLRSNIPLKALARFATSVGAQKTLTVGPDGAATDFVARAHGLGLPVYAWTYRDDEPAPDGVGSADELSRAYRLGIDGVFTDFPATAIAVRDRLETGQ